MANESLQQRIEQLRRQFVDRLPHDVGLMEELLARASDPTDDEVFREIKVVAHRLTGSSARFGYPNLSAQSAQVESHTAPILGTKGGGSDEFEELPQLIAALRTAITQPD